tara:strand:- start:772 stop:1122 length:351 start_codon:yes stop_codon:yes gene_type:complete
MNHYFLSSIVYYDNNKRSYYNIIVINEKPIGELSKYVVQKSLPKLSEYKTYDNDCNKKCKWCVTCFDDPSELLNARHFAELILFLKKNNYTIDVGLSDLIKKDESNNETMMAFISI